MSLVMACLECLALAAELPKETATHTVNSRFFAIPIYVSMSNRDEIKRLLLYCSSDEGKTWRKVQQAAPDASKFRFSAPADGIYWFLLQTIYKDGAKDPTDVAGGEPALIVRVATGGLDVKKSTQRTDRDRELALLRAKIKKLEKRIADLENREKSKP